MTGFLDSVPKKKFEPRPEQLRGLKLLMEQAGVRLFLHPGKGKTITVLKAFTILKQLGYVDTLLVLAPLRVITTTWPQEIEKWDDTDGLTYSLIHGDREMAMEKTADIYLMNVEGLLSPSWKLGEAKRGYPVNQKAMDFLRGKRVWLVVDESTLFKEGKSKRYRTLWKYLPAFVRRTIMTGTPQPNALEDLFFQCNLTDMGNDLGNYVTHFRMEYMTRGYDEKWAPQRGALERFTAQIAHCTLQLEDTEAMPVTVNDIWVPMPPDIKVKYQQLKREFVTMIEDKVVMAPNAGVLFGKLKQVAQGAVYNVPGVPEAGYVTLFDAKLDALQNLLEELQGEPLFILTQYQHDVARIRERLGYEVPYLGTGTSADQGKAFCQLFGQGGIPILMGHPSSVAYGIDGLQQNCNNVCWFGVDVSWEKYYQAVRRIARPGSKADQVFIHRIMTDVSIEHAALAIVEGKQKSEAEVMQILREQLVY